VHQRALGRLYITVREACPRGLETFFAPFDVVLPGDTVMQPDLLVAPVDAFTERELPEAPLLAVEVLSPSTRAFDLLLKKDRLERAGCAHYWVVDPDVPALRMWQLLDGHYVDSGSAQSSETVTVDLPFPVSITPSELVRA